MNKEDELKKIGDCINEDVKGITESFVPLYFDWVKKKGNDYLEREEESIALQATMNLLTNGLLNITTNVVVNFLRKANASKSFSDDLIDKVELTFNKGIKQLRQTCKDGFKEENK